MNILLRAAGAAVLAVIISGCATTSGLQPTEARSGFDGARIVDIEPHGTACKSMTCIALGAQWGSTTPEVSILKVVVFNDIRAITGAAVSIDGAISQLQPMPGLTGFGQISDPLKQSRKAFAVPLPLVRQMTAGHSVLVRVSTPDGYLESAVIGPDGDSKAFHALGRFLAAVDGQPKPAQQR